MLSWQASQRKGTGFLTAKDLADLPSDDEEADSPDSPAANETEARGCISVVQFFALRQSRAGSCGIVIESCFLSGAIAIATLSAGAQFVLRSMPFVFFGKLWSAFWSRSPSSALLPTFLGERSPTNIDYRKKFLPLCEPLYWRT